MTQTDWSEADYDSLSWHDNHVYGLEIHEGEHGTGKLILHLDHILEWLPPINGAYSFRIAPAILSFHEVSGLKLELDYLAVSAGMTPFSIGQISRETVTYATDYNSYRWSISINWPGVSSPLKRLRSRRAYSPPRWSLLTKSCPYPFATRRSRVGRRAPSCNDVAVKTTHPIPTR